MSAPKLLVATDLDGTLLDHHTYSWREALPSLSALDEHNVPVIINTSKTLEEVERLQHQLGLNAPFVVENGSAIYFPVHSRFGAIGTEAYDEQFTRIVLGYHREHILTILHNLRRSHQWDFEGFSDWHVDDVIQHTGLSTEDAMRAMKRQFSEPLLWRDSDANLKILTKSLQAAGLRVLRGGRFIHVLGQSDKGHALLALKKCMQLDKDAALIALGDSHNDLDMLNIADFPVFVRSPSHDFPEAHCRATPIYTEAYGPAGWHEAMSHILASNNFFNQES